jgi:hypothetical protein
MVGRAFRLFGSNGKEASKTLGTWFDAGLVRGGSTAVIGGDYAVDEAFESTKLHPRIGVPSMSPAHGSLACVRISVSCARISSAARTTLRHASSEI